MRLHRFVINLSEDCDIILFIGVKLLNNYIYCNIPSLISKNHDFYVFNKKYKTSISVKNNPKDIAEKVNKILKNKDLYFFLKKKNKEAFNKEFNFEKQIKKIEKLFT